MKPISLATFLGVFILSFCSFAGNKISMIRLISDPELYDSSSIILKGYLEVPGSGAAKLFINKTAFDINGPEYLIVEFGGEYAEWARKSSGCYVSITGLFQYSKYNRPMDFIGVIEKVADAYVFPGTCVQ